MKKLILAVVGAALVSGCTAHAVKKNGNYVTPVGGSYVTDNPTMYSKALKCVGNHLSHGVKKRTTFAVGQIGDMTGKHEYYTGKPITQGAALMAMSALDKMGVQLVERYDTSIQQLELKLANNKLIAGNRNGYKPIRAGSITPASFYLVGGITELNYNIHSSKAEIGYGPVAVGGKVFVLNIGIDLRLVHTDTLQVVKVVSYQKQMIGHEVRAGVFEFVGEEFLDIGVGKKAIEPIHHGIRAALERSVIDLVGSLENKKFKHCLPEAERVALKAAAAQQAEG